MQAESSPNVCTTGVSIVQLTLGLLALFERTKESAMVATSKDTTMLTNERQTLPVSERVNRPEKISENGIEDGQNLFGISSLEYPQRWNAWESVELLTRSVRPT